MRPPSWFLACVLATFTACGGSAPTSAPEAPRDGTLPVRDVKPLPTPETQVEAPPAVPATCVVDGVEGAHRVETVALPQGCTLDTMGSYSTPQVFKAAEAFAAALVCVGVAPPAIDFASRDVYAGRYAMSPAHGGRETLDDGATITFVTRFRQPCPSDLPPMPMEGTFAFQLPKDAKRTYREATCTLPLNCR